MEKLQALKQFNQLQGDCYKCQQKCSPYSLFITTKQTKVCTDCLIADANLLQTLNYHFAQQAYKIIKQIPTPHYSRAQECLGLIQNIKVKLQQSISKVQQNLENFKNKIEDYCLRVQTICENYLKKLDNYTTFDWTNLKQNQSLNQNKYLIHIHKHWNSLSQLIEHIDKLNINVPDFDIIKAGPKCISQTLTANIPITAMIYAKGNQYYGSADGKIIYWEKNKQLINFKAHDSLIRSFTYDDNFTLYSGGDDEFIKAWDLKQKQPQLKSIFGKISVHSYHRNMVVLNYGTMLASTRGQFDQYKIRVWSLQDCKSEFSLDGHDRFIRGLVALENDKIVSVSEDGTLKVWNFKEKKCIKTIYHRCRINNLLISPNSKTMALIDEQNRVILLETQDYEIFGSWNIGRKIYCSCAGKYLYLGLQHTVNIYDWIGSQLQIIRTDLQIRPQNMMQIADRIVISNGTGNLYKYLVKCLQ